MGNNYCVYVHTRKQSSENGVFKKYVGLTGRKPEDRWLNGRGYKGSTHFFNAIQKYGWDGFEHKIVAHGLTKAEAKRLETKLISEYKSNIEDYGYNLTTGGETSILNESSKLKISKANSGKNNGMYGRCGALHPQYGKPCPEYTKRMLSLKNKGNIPPNRRPVVCLETGEKFDCINHVEEKFGIKDGKSHIGEVCVGKRNVAVGMHWMFLEDYNTLTKKEISNILSKSKYRFQRVINLNTGAIYKSKNDCAYKNNTYPIKIKKICEASDYTLGFMYYTDFCNLDNKIKDKIQQKWECVIGK